MPEQHKDEVKNLATPGTFYAANYRRKRRVILSTTLILEPGSYCAEEITEEQALLWVQSVSFVNYCNHETVRILGIEPAQTRLACPGYDEALCLKPKARLEFGREYSADEIAEIGVTFMLIQKQGN